jgi:hypothetical protein
VRTIRTVVVAAVIVATMALMGSALAQQSGSDELPDDTVRGKFFDRDRTAPGDDVLGELFPGERGESVLPFTGADLTLFVVAGVVAVAAGATIVRRTRARRAQT